jgi:hypothetical protein
MTDEKRRLEARIATLEEELEEEQTNSFPHTWMCTPGTVKTFDSTPLGSSAFILAWKKPLQVFF